MDTVPNSLYPPTTPTPLPTARDVVPVSIVALPPAAAPSTDRLKWFAIELAASGTTLAGMYVGSTTTQGAWLYLVSLIFWYALTFKRKLWGLLPLNLATTVVAFINLSRSMGAVAAPVTG